MSEQRRQSGKGYGNIYTPHAGSMIIHVQRESGLQNRTLVLTPRQVRLLRLATSRYGLIAATLIVGSWAFFAVQAARVPLLRNRIVSMEQDAAKMDTLQATVGELQRRYEQVQRMMGVAPAAAADEPRTLPVSSQPVAEVAGAASSGAATVDSVATPVAAARPASAAPTARRRRPPAPTSRTAPAPVQSTPVQSAPVQNAPVQSAPQTLPPPSAPAQGAPPAVPDGGV